MPDEPVQPELAASRKKSSEQSELKMLLGLAIPNILTTAAETALSITDFAIVSQLDQAAAAQSAVASAGLLFITAFGIPLGILICVTTLASQSLGAKRLRDCPAYGWQGLWLSVPTGLLGLALIPFVPAIFAWIGHDAVVQQMEVDYLQIRLLSLGMAGVCVALGSYFNGIHRPHLNTISVVVANVINVVLSYGLVLGKFGLPEMGVAGAAWGTVAASTVRAVSLWAIMCFGRQGRAMQALHAWRIDLDKLGRLVWIGLPSGAAIFFDIGGWAMFMNVVIGKLGTTHLAASATAWRYVELSFMPALGIAAAVSTAVGKAIGERRIDLARRRAALGLRVNFLFMGTMGAIYVLLNEQLISVFTDDPEVIKVGARILVCAAIFQLFDAVAITYDHALRGAGDTHWPAFVSATQNWIILVGGSYWAVTYHPEWGSAGAWAFGAVFVAAIGTTLGLRWRNGKWKSMDILTTPVAHLEVTAAESFQSDAALSPDAVAAAELNPSPIPSPIPSPDVADDDDKPHNASKD